MKNLFYVTLIQECGFKRKSVVEAETGEKAILNALGKLDERTYWKIDRAEAVADKGNK